MSDSVVRFSKGTVAVVGLLISGALAVGLPVAVLVWGQNLGVGLQATIIILAALMGTGLGIVSAFFGIVIPSNVGNVGRLVPNIRFQGSVSSREGKEEAESADPGSSKPPGS
jgi:hypothetical protein